MTMTRAEAAAKASAAAKAAALARGPSATAKRASNRELQRVYWVWCAMRYRCLNPNDKAYKNYGGRGITVCEAWRTSFEAFLLDMGPRPAPNSTIERINNDGGYFPTNCKWATRQEQSLNKRVYKNSPIGEPSISLRHNGTYRVRIRRGGILIFNKTFRKVSAAIQARNGALSGANYAAR